jgi:integrase
VVASVAIPERNRDRFGESIRMMRERKLTFEEAEPARMALEKMAELKHPTSELVFHRVDGSRWGDIAKSFDTLVDRAGLQRKAPDNLTMHSLRHTFASWCSLGGLSLRRLQSLLGHKSITTTERYSHLGNSGVHPAYARLSSFLNDFLPTGIPTEPSDAEKREREEP